MRFYCLGVSEYGLYLEGRAILIRIPRIIAQLAQVYTGRQREVQVAQLLGSNTL